MSIELLNKVIREIKARKARADYYNAVATALARVDLTGIDEMAQEFTRSIDLN